MNAAEDLVYVSVAPNTAPTGRYATVRVVGNPTSVATAVLDGGFDPVPIAAEPGDSVAITITDGEGAIVASLGAPVTGKRPPLVVRTNPRRRKTDVPLNASIVIVFSEPIAGSTLTSESVQLVRGATEVAGTVRLLAGTATAAVLKPSAPLEPNTDYRLIVRQSVRDLAGDALETEEMVEFTTGTTVLGAVQSVYVVPGGDSAVEAGIGSQFQMTAIPRDARSDTGGIRGNILAGLPTVWSSEDPLVAAVSPTGLVTALTEGLATIVADVEGVLGSGHVRVSSGLAPVGSVIVTPDSTRVPTGAKLVLGLEIRDLDGNPLEPRPSAWTSSNPEVATVTQVHNRGAEVTGVAVGIAKITATVEGKSDTAVVAVGPAGTIVGLVLSPDSLTLVLQARKIPSAAGIDDQGFLNPIPPEQVAWVTSDPSIASVTTAGLVTGVQGGSTTITGTWDGHQATVSVTVVELSFTAISAGGSHSCGITSSGAAFCWGDGLFGALGSGGTCCGLPDAVVGGHAFTTVSVESNSTCGLATDGTAYCWGEDEEHGTETSPSGRYNDKPTAVPGGIKFTALSAGPGGWACGVSADSVAYCWLGSETPQTVGLARKVTAISTSRFHTCALTLGGFAYCWGLNRDGQLGTGDTDNSASPRPVAGGLTFVAISAGWSHTSALTPDGAAYAWGKSPSWSTAGSLTPRRVMIGVSFVELSAGQYDTGGLDSSGTAHFWNDATSWVVPGGFSFASLDVGRDHHCAMTGGGVGYCWGQNYLGQLGIGQPSDLPLPPVKVGGQP